jgi:hypothetical protein
VESKNKLIGTAVVKPQDFFDLPRDNEEIREVLNFLYFLYMYIYIFFFIFILFFLKFLLLLILIIQKKNK